MAKVKVYQNLHAGYTFYFVKLSNNGRMATGIGVRYLYGKWEVAFNVQFYSQNLKCDSEHFPIVGEIDLNGAIVDAVLRLEAKEIEKTENKERSAEQVKPYQKSFLDEDEEHGKYSSTYWMCPNCNTHIGVKYNNFCSFCGAKLDWSEEIAKLFREIRRGTNGE